METFWDEALDYERVKEFLKLFDTIPPQTVSNAFVNAIRNHRGRELNPDIIMDLVIHHAGNSRYEERFEEYKKIFSKYPNEARYAVEYYQAWEKLPKKQKDRIKKARYRDWAKKN